MYGDAFSLEEPLTGLVHVTALARVRDTLHTLRIAPGAPQSPHDFLALQLVRAHADVVLISGQILRDEPSLSYRFAGPLAGALEHVRAQILGKPNPVEVSILTRSGSLPPHHPLFRGPNPVHILTGDDGAQALPATLRGHLRRRTTPSLSDAVSFARAELGARTISNEAGPSLSAALYERPEVDEPLDEGPARLARLHLSVFEGVAPAPRHLADAPFDMKTLAAAGLERIGHAHEVQELSGPWRFSRWRPRAP